MDLTPFNFSRTRRVAVLLGAGATRGAKFVDDRNLLKPPLDADFFRMVRASGLGAEIPARAVLNLMQDQFGAANMGMEHFYSQISLHDQFVSSISNGKKGRLRKFATASEHFITLIPKLFKMTIGIDECEWHQRLAGAAQSADTFISFNYDCVLDRSVKVAAKRRWSPSKGYGFPAGGAVDQWQDHTGRGPYPKTGISILKPHGSLNWRRTASGAINLAADEYDFGANSRPLIVPPLWQKNYNEESFSSVWSGVRRALASAKGLFVIGYALPQTDVYTQAALRMDVPNLDFLCIVNPDDDARGRTLDVLKSSIGPSTHVVEFDTIGQMSQLLDPVAV